MTLILALAGLVACGADPDFGFAPANVKDPYIEVSPGRFQSMDCVETPPELRYATPSGCMLDEAFNRQVSNPNDLRGGTSRRNGTLSPSELITGETIVESAGQP